MHTKGASSDAIRVSTSSAPSTSSHGSAQDDYDSSGDVYVWGEVICDNTVRVGPDTVIRSTAKADFLLPKPLESKLVLDVYHVDCGVKHAALVTKNGEVFTWGEESGGRLGHGSREDSVHPRLVESLAICNVDIVACGEFHTCAVTTSGELYTWGDGTHNIGLLGNGTDVSLGFLKEFQEYSRVIKLRMFLVGPGIQPWLRRGGSYLRLVMVHSEF